MRIMRLVTFEVESRFGRDRKTGALSGDRVIDLSAARANQLRQNRHPAPVEIAQAELPSDMVELLKLGSSSLAAAREAVAHAEDDLDKAIKGSYAYTLDDVWLLPPLPRPPSLRCFLAGVEHVRRAFKEGPPQEWTQIPVYYKANCDEIYGPEDTVPWPAYSDKLDYELEICAVIGTAGRNVSVEQADNLIVGYTIYNDWSARDIQLREMSVGLGPSYGKDFASSIGPAIVTKDEFDLSRAQLTSRINGEEWSSGTSGELQFSFPEIISWVSQEQTLHPGDLLGSGPVGGGNGVELDRWLPESSVVELEVEGIGVLRNYVSARGAGPVRAVDKVAGSRTK